MNKLKLYFILDDEIIERYCEIENLLETLELFASARDVMFAKVKPKCLYEFEIAIIINEMINKNWSIREPIYQKQKFEIESEPFKYQVGNYYLKSKITEMTDYGDFEVCSDNALCISSEIKILNKPTIFIKVLEEDNE